MTNTGSNFSPVNDWASGTNTEAARLFDYAVIDATGEKIGKVANIWMNDNERHGFIAINNGWIFGRQCLIPMESIQVDHTHEQISIPFSKDLVKNSPDVAEDYNVTSEEGQQVRDHYNLGGDAGMQTGANTAYQSGTFNRTGEDARMNDDIADDHNVIDDTPIDRHTGDPGGYNIAAASASANMQNDIHHDDEVDEKEIHLAQEEVNQPVELRREDVIVERVDDAGDVIDGEAFTEDEVDIELKREEPVVDKKVRSAGTIRARKVTDTEQQNIQETVRKEDVEVDRNADDVTSKKSKRK